MDVISNVNKQDISKYTKYLNTIGTTWYKCDQDGCDYKCKQASILKKHKAHIHDIGINGINATKTDVITNVNMRVISKDTASLSMT